MPLNVLAILPGLSPSAFLTVVKPLLALHKSGAIIADFTLEAWFSKKALERADVVVFSRNTESKYEWILDRVLKLGIPVIYDLDDNFFELPQLYQDELPYKKRSNETQLGRYLTSANLVRVYSNELLNRILQLNTRVVRVNGPVDFSLIPAALPVRDPSRVRIVYATSRTTHDDLANLFLNDLKKVLSTYQEKVEVFFWGHHPQDFRGHPSVRFLDFNPNYDRFFENFSKYGFDIGLAPLRDEVFYRSKSNNKFREYGACRIAGVYSDVEVYSECVTHGQTGWLVSQRPDAWSKAISHLLDYPALRESIQDQAFQFIKEHYCLEDVSAIWLSHLKEVSHKQSIRAHPNEREGHVLRQNKFSSAIINHWNSFLTRFLGLGVVGNRMIGHLKNQGVFETAGKIQRVLHELYMLLRIKWLLIPWRKSKQ